MALAWIPKSILIKSRIICSSFLWAGKKDQKVLPWVKWDQIARLKALGGWGIKNTAFFAKSLATKLGWRLITTQSLWTEVITHKYITPTSVLDWIRDFEFKKHKSGSIIWKSLCKSFSLIAEGLVWKVGDGRKVRIGADPWIGSAQNHILPQPLIQIIHQKGYFHINQIADPISTNIWHQGWRKSHDLELPEQWASLWDQYILALQSSHFRITDREAELIWEKAQLGKYTPKDWISTTLLTILP